MRREGVRTEGRRRVAARERVRERERAERGG